MKSLHNQKAVDL